MSVSLMWLFEVEEVLQATRGTLIVGESRRRGFRRIQTDSRKVKTGDLFLALQGPNFDGHDYLLQACERGAYGVLIQESRASGMLPRRGSVHRTRSLVIGVKNTLRAYQELARFHRSKFSIPVVAITGSNGKTTTKEMVSQILSTTWRVHKTQENFNNAIGVPQTVLGLRGTHQAAVIEMGVDQVGQTDRLCEIARPTVGVITNVGPDHLEFYRTMARSAASKGELLKWLPQDGAAVLNADDRYCSRFVRQAKSPVVSFGFSPDADISAMDIQWDGRQTTFKLGFPSRKRRRNVSLRVMGSHNVSNALAGAGVGHVLGVSVENIIKGLGKFRPASMRSEVLQKGGVTYIYDCYNANPASVKAALELLVSVDPARRTIAILGDMLELGPQEQAFHEEIGKYAADKRVTHVIACGAFGPLIGEGAAYARGSQTGVTVVKDAIGAGRALRQLVDRGDIVLIKASRGMRMERVLEAVQAKSGN